MTLLELAKQYESDVETRIKCINEDWDNADDAVHYNEECAGDYNDQIMHWKITLVQIRTTIKENS